jgi:hypothetical protein
LEYKEAYANKNAAIHATPTDTIENILAVTVSLDTYIGAPDSQAMPVCNPLANYTNSSPYHYPHTSFIGSPENPCKKITTEYASYSRCFM